MWLHLILRKVEAGFKPDRTSQPTTDSPLARYRFDVYIVHQMHYTIFFEREGTAMKYIIGFLSVFFLFGCSKDDSAGSRIFIPEDLTVLSLTTIRGETVNTPAGDTGSSTNLNIIHIGGTIDSQSGLELTGLKLRVRVLGENGTPLGMGEDLCTPAEIAAGGSCNFSTSIVLEGADYRTSQSIEITPGCDQGTGTVRLIPVVWPDS